MDNKQGLEDEMYALIDPKISPTSDGTNGSRHRTQCSTAIVFIAGPGNYLEYLSLRQQLGQPAAGGGKKITYGCAEVLTPQQFLAASAQCAS